MVRARKRPREAARSFQAVAVATCCAYLRHKEARNGQGSPGHRDGDGDRRAAGAAAVQAGTPIRLESPGTALPPRPCGTRAPLARNVQFRRHGIALLGGADHRSFNSEESRRRAHDRGRRRRLWWLRRLRRLDMKRRQSTGFHRSYTAVAELSFPQPFSRPARGSRETDRDRFAAVAALLCRGAAGLRGAGRTGDRNAVACRR